MLLLDHVLVHSERLGLNRLLEFFNKYWSQRVFGPKGTWVGRIWTNSFSVHFRFGLQSCRECDGKTRILTQRALRYFLRIENCEPLLRLSFHRRASCSATGVRGSCICMSVRPRRTSTTRTATTFGLTIRTVGHSYSEYTGHP